MNARIVTGILQQIHHMRPTRIGHLVKTLNLVVVGNETGKHHVPAGVAISDGDVGMFEA